MKEIKKEQNDKYEQLIWFCVKVLSLNTEREHYQQEEHDHCLASALAKSERYAQ